MKKKLFFTLSLMLTSLWAQLDEKHTHAIVVLAETMESTTGKMWIFHKDKDWNLETEAADVSLGRTGLAWSHGLHGPCPKGQSKRREGSYKSPAGIYPIDTVFGLNALQKGEKFGLPYIHFTSSIEAVDDPNSQYYNQIVDTRLVQKDWNSSEDVSNIPVYEYGAVVGFNQNPQDKEAGSAIFIHLWRAPGYPTAGCTAMAKEDLLGLLHGLHESDHPVIIQMTYDDYRRYQKEWKLPPMAQLDVAKD